MPSPFPGMNPYLERATAWDSFHPHFISTAFEQIAAQLPPEYVVRIENRVYIHEPPLDDRRFVGKGDLGVGHPPGSMAGGGGIPAAVIAPAYITIPDAVEVERVGHLTIRDRDGNDLITLIELLSPTNKKHGADRVQYEAKRRELLRSPAHFVEIDLLRGGPRMNPDDLPSCDYCAIVSRVEERPRAGVWPWRLRDPMPVLPIPLRRPGPDARLDLKAVVDTAYSTGRHVNYIYKGPPEPPLAPVDAAWAAAFLPASS